ncbi:unnamed protein product [Linum trigynum]|uniref:Uncharacterized protein n=1 Tax=Linum trigynum TaxID=586398 RepID=A0AAV2CXM9_9ROSI
MAASPDQIEEIWPLPSNNHRRSRGVAGWRRGTTTKLGKRPPCSLLCLLARALWWKAGMAMGSSGRGRRAADWRERRSRGAIGGGGRRRSARRLEAEGDGGVAGGGAARMADELVKALAARDGQRRRGWPWLREKRVGWLGGGGGGVGIGIRGRFGFWWGWSGGEGGR